MLKAGHKSVITLISVFLFVTCIDPYNPKLEGYMSLLVVDGLITDSNTSYTINLSRTFQDQNASRLMVSDVTVFITDDNGNSSYLINRGNGIYKTDSLQFKGVPGRTYVLHIHTNEGTKYESDPCPMQPVPEIDSIYFSKDEELTSNGTQSQKGISIYLDSKGSDNNQFYRWAYNETWKFKVPYPKKYNFNIADSAITLVSDIKEYCWKNKRSDEILIYSNYSGQAGPVRKVPIFFIASDQSDRLLIQYSIMVDQYSISKKEYDFWNNLKQVNESGGDIFSKQPFTVVSNIKNISNPKERVLGYFQVSAVKQRRKDITFNDIAGLNLPNFQYPCEMFVRDPSDYPKAPGAPPTTWAEIYSMWCITADYYFVEPQYSSGMGSKRNISKLVFAKPGCANCEITGKLKKPDFWIDLN